MSKVKGQQISESYPILGIVTMEDNGETIILKNALSVSRLFKMPLVHTR